MRNWVFLLFFICLITCSAIAMAENPIIIKIVTTQPADFELSPTYSAFYRFKDYVESATDGKVKVRLFMGGPLGPSEKSNLEAVRVGSMQMAHTSEGPVPQFYRPVELLSIPYLFSSETIAWRVLDGPFGKELSKAIARDVGVRILAYTENGFRCFTNNVRLIKEPNDLKGIKMRIMESPIFISMMKSLGAEPIPVPWMELYTALKNNVADGQENALSLILQAKFYQVQKYLTLDEHCYGPHFIWINEKFYQKLPNDIKLIVMQGAKIAQTVHRGQQQALHAHAMVTLKANGMIIYKPSPTEKQLFKNACQKPVIEYLKQHIDKKWFILLFDEIKKAEQAEAQSWKG